MERDEELVGVYSTDDPTRVALARMWLDAEGMPYVADNLGLSAFYPVDGMAIVTFKVSRREAKRALEILRSHELR